MHEKLRIHHGVGSRVLLDSDKTDNAFTYSKVENGEWHFSVDATAKDVAEVLPLKDEVNVFIFREENGVAVEKVWFYTGKGEIQYDESTEKLLIRATSQIIYHPGDYES